MGKLQKYVNVDALIGVIVSRKLATLYELQTVYSLEDAYCMYEVIVVDNHNERELIKEAKSGNRH